MVKFFPLSLSCIVCLQRCFEKMPTSFQAKLKNIHTRSVFNKLRGKKSVTITEYDPTYKVVYLGNVITGWAKGEGSVDKPLSTLWRNYCQSSKPDIQMKLTVTSSGLKAVTREHGLTEYWSHRVTYCCTHPQYPKVFCWVYRHEGRKMKQELRCHAVLCNKEHKAEHMASLLRQKLNQALQEFKKEKLFRQNARLSLANCVYDNPSLPQRKILLFTGSQNYKPPIERSKSAPKLMAIEEEIEEDDNETASELASPRLLPTHCAPIISEDELASSLASEPISDIAADFDSQSEDYVPDCRSGGSPHGDDSDDHEEVVSYDSMPDRMCSVLNTLNLSGGDVFSLIEDEEIPYHCHISTSCRFQSPDLVDKKHSFSTDSDNVSEESGYSEEGDLCLVSEDSPPPTQKITFICTI